jgi:hypothetical protein
VPPGGRELGGREVARGQPDPEATYYQTVEEFFVSRRGDPLFLSHADWHRVSKWRRAGIPLRIVLRGIGDALDSHDQSWSRRRKVGSLAYCAAEVEAAWERWQRAVAFTADEGVGTSAFLRSLCDSLDALAGRGQSVSALAAETSEEIRNRAGADPLQLEGWLRSKEAEVVAALESAMGRKAVAAIEAAVRADLAPYRKRMPDKVAARIEAESLARRVLEAHGLPRFGLFDS